MEKKELTAREAEEGIEKGWGTDLKDKIIKGDLDLSVATIVGGLHFKNVTIEGSLFLPEAIIKGDLWLEETIITGALLLHGATINGKLWLDRTFIEDFLNLEGATINNSLNLATRKGPTKIYVDEEMAQLVHFAAPNIPLVVKKKKQ